MLKKLLRWMKSFWVSLFPTKVKLLSDLPVEIEKTEISVAVKFHHNNTGKLKQITKQYERATRQKHPFGPIKPFA